MYCSHLNVLLSPAPFLSLTINFVSFFFKSWWSSSILSITRPGMPPWRHRLVHKQHPLCCTALHPQSPDSGLLACSPMWPILPDSACASGTPCCCRGDHCSHSAPEPAVGHRRGQTPRCTHTGPAGPQAATATADGLRPLALSQARGTPLCPGGFWARSLGQASARRSGVRVCAKWGGRDLELYLRQG